MVIDRLVLLELRVGFVTGVRVPTVPAEPALTLRETVVMDDDDVVPVLREVLLSPVTVRLALVLLGRL